MRWLLVVMWGVLALALGLGLMQVDGALSAPAAQPTAYPIPSPSATRRITPSGPVCCTLYLPIVNSIHPGAPAAPVARVSPIRTGGYRLQWEAVSEVAAYRVYEAASNASGMTEIGMVLPGQPLEMTFGPRPAGVYSYRVSAANTAGATPSQTLTVTVPAGPRLSVVEMAGGGYAVAWSTVANAAEYVLYEATNADFSDARVVSGGSTSPWPDRVVFGARPRGTYYYRALALTAQVGTWGETLAVQTPRPGLWGRVTFNGQAQAGIVVELRRCRLSGATCTDRITLDTATTQSDGTYSFTAVAATDNTTALYVLFDNPRRDRNYLNFWRGRNVVAYNGRDPVEASRFDIANIFLEEPAPEARVRNPATFRWRPRVTRIDSYCVMFLDGQLNPLVPCVRLGYRDTTVLDVEGVLTFGTQYNWTMWLEVDGQGYGEAFYYRPITIVTGTGGKDAVRLDQARPSGAEPGVPQRETDGPQREPR